MRTTIIAGIFAILGAFIGSGVTYKIATDSRIASRDMERFKYYSNLLRIYAHRTAVLEMEQREYWDSRTLFDPIYLIGPEIVSEAAREFAKASNRAYNTRKEGKADGWQNDSNSPYRLWDVKREALLNAMKDALPTFRVD